MKQDPLYSNKTKKLEALTEELDSVNIDMFHIDFNDKKENVEKNSERAVVLHSYNNLLTYPWIYEAINKKALEIHGWWLDFKSVTLWKKLQGSDSFKAMEF